MPTVADSIHGFLDTARVARFSALTCLHNWVALQAKQDGFQVGQVLDDPAFVQNIMSYLRYVCWYPHKCNKDTLAGFSELLRWPLGELVQIVVEAIMPLESDSSSIERLRDVSPTDYDLRLRYTLTGDGMAETRCTETVMASFIKRNRMPECL